MCAAVLKKWREAATVMLVHGRKTMKSRLLEEFHPPFSIDALEQAQPNDSLNGLDLLVLKRNSKSSFLPNLYVFPGGTAENADFSRGWLPLFGASTVEITEKLFGFAKPKDVSHQSPMFHRSREKDFTFLPSEVAFRLCAIRKTFEESGILLARSIDQIVYEYNPSPTFSYTFAGNHESQVEEWREKIRRDPAGFLSLCKTHSIVPDIWSLYNWSNWMTPVSDTLKADDTRFDAAFFVCCIRDRPGMAASSDDTEHALWANTRQLIADYHENRVQLAPPQMYEASRLINFNNLEDLLEFLKARIGQPVERWMPVRIKCADAILFTFPGDSLYPEKPDFDGEQPVLQRSETLEELSIPQANLHRAVISIPPKDASTGSSAGLPQFQIQCNIKLPHGHVTPVLK